MIILIPGFAAYLYETTSYQLQLEFTAPLVETPPTHHLFFLLTPNPHSINRDDSSYP